MYRLRTIFKNFSNKNYSRSVSHFRFFVIPLNFLVDNLAGGIGVKTFTVAFYFYSQLFDNLILKF